MKTLHRFFWIVLMIMAAVPHWGFSKAYSTAPFGLFLVPSSFMQPQDIMKAADVQQTDMPKTVEVKKIQYLLSQIRVSPYRFVKGGGIEAPGHLAFTYLRQQYVRSSPDIASAEEFIERIASRSEASNETYYVRISEDELYPLRDILYNELYRLESYLWVKGPHFSDAN